MIEDLAEATTTTTRTTNDPNKGNCILAWMAFYRVYKSIRMSTISRYNHHSKMANIQENPRTFDNNGRQEEVHVSSVMHHLGNVIINY